MVIIVVYLTNRRHLACVLSQTAYDLVSRSKFSLSFPPGSVFSTAPPPPPPGPHSQGHQPPPSPSLFSINSYQPEKKELILRKKRIHSPKASLEKPHHQFLRRKRLSLSPHSQAYRSKKEAHGKVFVSGSA